MCFMSMNILYTIDKIPTKQVDTTTDDFFSHMNHLVDLCIDLVTLDHASGAHKWLDRSRLLMSWSFTKLMRVSCAIM